MILTNNGENISPDELENLLEKNNLVKKAVVSQEDNQIVARLFVDDLEFNYEELINNLNITLPKYMRIDKFNVLKNNIDNKLK